FAEDRIVLAGALTTLVLHEDEVPDLDVSVLVRLGTTIGPVLGPPVVEDLGAGTTGAGNAQVQVVLLLPHALDAFEAHADLVAPDVRGLVVVEVDRHPQSLGIEAEPTVLDRGGDQFPGQRYRFLLEVVAEGEVAQHLEEGGVPGGPTDLFDVRGADALLDAGGRVVGRGALSEKVG